MVHIRRELVPGVEALGCWILLGQKAADSVWVTSALGVLLFPARGAGSRSVGSGSCSRKEPFFFLVLLYCYSCLNRTIYDVFV